MPCSIISNALEPILGVTYGIHRVHGSFSNVKGILLPYARP